MDGDFFDQDDLVATHSTLPLGSYATVTNENTGRTVVVRIVDQRGPAVVGRVMTLSRGAFKQIADLDQAVVPCEVSMT
jgi:rare lipoprotein A